MILRKKLLMLLAVNAALVLTGIEAAAQQSSNQAPTPITLRPGDVIRIRVWPDTTLGGTFSVEENGTASLPLAGEVQLVGRSIDDIRAMLRELYRETLKAPVVNVTPMFRVSILGAVERPGLYLIDPTQTLFDLVSIAGGFRRDAKEEEMRILRDTGVIELNATRALEVGGTDLNLALRPGDRVIVPESRSFSLQSALFVVQTLAVIVTLLTRN
jgi:protein involved in polysaccharide export with SLBB domain